MTRTSVVKNKKNKRICQDFSPDSHHGLFGVMMCNWPTLQCVRVSHLYFKIVATAALWMSVNYHFFFQKEESTEKVQRAKRNEPESPGFVASYKAVSLQIKYFAY